ncbi:hypothetical protein CDAR_220161 [Caerostris darwini]|uniref:Uncharacterized protein n=1 Tax=Caerostris darwini TaxID=1538125 RepID=A0AAV4VIE2_9ARAC|nr:hypothetical protein CDAR_220161 [Caerostris darwini]
MLAATATYLFTAVELRGKKRGKERDVDLFRLGKIRIKKSADRGLKLRRQVYANARSIIAQRHEKVQTLVIWGQGHSLLENRSRVSFVFLRK